jgi:uncharacterized protein (TIGR02117 family)
VAPCFFAAPIAYIAAALAGALIPANSGWRPPPQGIRVFVQTNGIHTSIVVPVRAAGIDWTRLIHPAQLQRPGLAGDHLAFAWGHREFYLTTPTWADLRLGVVVRALSGQGGSLMHVEHLSRPEPAADQRPILLTPAQYGRLSRFILASFQLSSGEMPVPLAGYGPADFFYEARGRYTLLRTSNEWTAAALRRAGVRIGIWSPFAQSIMWCFPLEPSRDPGRVVNTP